MFFWRDRGRLAEECVNNELIQWLAGATTYRGTGTVVDSLCAWSNAAFSATDVEVADIVVVDGDGVIRVEADGSWADSDSTGLVYAYSAQLDSLAAIAAITPRIHALASDSLANPHSTSRVILKSSRRQLVEVGFLHAHQGADTLAYLRYGPIYLDDGSLIVADVSDTLETFALHVDLDADGTFEAIHYPGELLSASPPKLESESVQLVLDSANPLSSKARLTFTVPNRAPVYLAIYDSRGRSVRPLINELMDPGAKSISWDGIDSSGRRLPSGVYFARLDVAGRSSSLKLVLAR